MYLRHVSFATLLNVNVEPITYLSSRITNIEKRASRALLRGFEANKQ